MMSSTVRGTSAVADFPFPPTALSWIAYAPFRRPAWAVKVKLCFPAAFV